MKLNHFGLPFGLPLPLWGKEVCGDIIIKSLTNEEFLVVVILICEVFLVNYKKTLIEKKSWIII